MTRVRVAVAVVLDAAAGRDRVLVAHRAPERHQGGFLEFPGGKVEAGEQSGEALCRELAEEVGIGVELGELDFLVRLDHDYGDRQVRIDAFTTRRFSGEPRGLEGQQLEWRDLDSLRAGDFPPANRAILQALQQPAFVLVTGNSPCVRALARDELVRRLASWSGNDCVLRAPGQGKDTYRRDFETLLEPAREARVRLLVHGEPRRLDHCREAAGLHMPWSVAADCVTRPVSRAYRLGVSCHSASALAHAQRLDADYAFVSPVRATVSHPEREALGWEAFCAMAAAVELPVYALGGLTAADLTRVRRHGGCGVAGIGFWWNTQGGCDA